MGNWNYGAQIVRREVIRAGVWFGTQVFVIEDSAEQLITYIPNGAHFEFPKGNWPIPNGCHPWSDHSSWKGHGVLMIQKPGEPFAIWHFWKGDSREFSCWYINLQVPFRKTSIGYDTQDLELDFIVDPDKSWEVKDEELVHQRAREGRWTLKEADEIIKYGNKLKQRLATNDPWWDLSWSNWKPDPAWHPSPLPKAWNQLPSPPYAIANL